MAFESGMTPVRMNNIAMLIVAVVVAVVLAGCAGQPSSATSSPPAAPSPSASVTAAPATSARVSTSPSPSAIACLLPDPVDCRLEAIETAAVNGDFIGVILIARDGKPIWQRAFGKNESGDARQVGDRLGIESVGKMFTAVAVAQQAEAGRLRFADAVGGYIPGLPADVSKATIHQLLSHTSGLGTGTWTDGLAFAPGTFNYSNAGFNLAALVVERVTDQTFSDYLERHVFEPAGMTATGYEKPQPRGAPLGLGGELSTAGDLLRFADALTAHRLLSKSMTQRITSKKVDYEFGGYGYGLAIFGQGDEVKSFGHFGQAFASTAGVEINPELGVTVIVLSDQGWGAVEPALIEFQKSIRMGYFRG